MPLAVAAGGAPKTAVLCRRSRHVNLIDEPAGSFRLFYRVNPTPPEHGLDSPIRARHLQLVDIYDAGSFLGDRYHVAGLVHELELNDISAAVVVKEDQVSHRDSSVAPV